MIAGKILGVDPSLTCCGYAIIEIGDQIRRPVECGAITAESGLEGVANRALSIASQLADAAENHADDIIAICVEMPQSKGWGRENRNTTTLPSYGIAVGACLQRMSSIAIRVHATLVTPAAESWCIGINRGTLPNGKPDPAKPGRRMAVRQRMPEAGRILDAAERDGTMTRERLGDVADAYLLAMYAETQIH